MRFRVLGPLRVWNAAAWSPIRAAQQRQVLAVLLLAEAGRVVAVERLVNEIWGADPPRSALRTVQGYVFRLRRMLGDGNPIVTRGGGYELVLDEGDLDAHVFGRRVAAGERCLAEGRLEAAVAELSQALALWQGSALSDVPAGATVTAETARLEHVRLDTVEARLGALLDLGHHDDVAAEAQRLAAENPLREQLWAQLMLALARCGRRGEALDAYQQARRALVADLGLEPSPELRQLQLSILAEDAPGAEPVSPSPAGPLSARIAALVVPAQLPADVGAFTGRQESLKHLDGLLRGGGESASAVVISTIAGTAGVGKTALAVHWAHQVRDQFPDGQLYLNLRGYGTDAPMRPVDALATLLSALGMPAKQVPTDTEQAASLYRSLLADKQTLIVLDNANHPDQVRPLLPANPGCLALITSRDQLRGLTAIDGAVRLNLDVLTPTEAHTLLARLLGAERIDAEPTAAADLAQLCGHLPLAIRIAAANLTAHPHTTITRYAAQLATTDRLAALQVEGDAHAGVRAAFDHSYAALPSQDQHLFRLLGLVPGPDLTAPAVAALAGIDTATAALQLDRLATAHLVNEHTPGRYIVHDLIRRYAIEQTNTEDSPPHRHAALGRLCDHYLQGIAAAATILYPHVLRLPLPVVPHAAALTDHAQVLAWLDAERPNLVAAVEHTAMHGPWETAWRIADALRGYLHRHMHTTDWHTVAHAGLAAAEADADRDGQAAAHLSLATLRYVQGRYQRAIDHDAAALSLARQSGWKEGESAALGNLGGTYVELGELRKAAEHYTEALAIDRRIGQPVREVVNLSNVGFIHSLLGQLAPAASQLEQAAQLRRQLKSRDGEGRVLANLGDVYRELGRFDDALDTLTQALTLHREVGDRHNEPHTLRGIAAVHRDAGRLGEAAEVARTALALARDIQAPHIEADTLITQAAIQQHLGHHRQAIDGHRQGLDIARGIGNRYSEAAALLGLATACLQAGEPDQATHHIQQALDIARDCEYRILEGNALAVLATIHLGQTPELAIVHARQALAIHAETGHRLGEARTHLIAHHALRDTGREQEALEHLRLAHALFDALGVRGEPG